MARCPTTIRYVWTDLDAVDAKNPEGIRGHRGIGPYNLAAEMLQKDGQYRVLHGQKVAGKYYVFSLTHGGVAFPSSLMDWFSIQPQVENKTQVYVPFTLASNQASTATRARPRLPVPSGAQWTKRPVFPPKSGESEGNTVGSYMTHLFRSSPTRFPKEFYSPDATEDRNIAAKRLVEYHENSAFRYYSLRNENPKKVDYWNLPNTIEGPAISEGDASPTQVTTHRIEYVLGWPESTTSSKNSPRSNKLLGLPEYATGPYDASTIHDVIRTINETRAAVTRSWKQIGAINDQRTTMLSSVDAVRKLIELSQKYRTPTPEQIETKNKLDDVRKAMVVAIQQVPHNQRIYYTIDQDLRYQVCDAPEEADTYTEQNIVPALDAQSEALVLLLFKNQVYADYIQRFAVDNSFLLDVNVINIAFELLYAIESAADTLALIKGKEGDGEQLWSILKKVRQLEVDHGRTFQRLETSSPLEAALHALSHWGIPLAALSARLLDVSSVWKHVKITPMAKGERAEAAVLIKQLIEPSEPGLATYLVSNLKDGLGKGMSLQGLVYGAINAHKAVEGAAKIEKWYREPPPGTTVPTASPKASPPGLWLLQVAQMGLKTTSAVQGGNSYDIASTISSDIQGAAAILDKFSTPVGESGKSNLAKVAGTFGIVNGLISLVTAARFTNKALSREDDAASVLGLLGFSLGALALGAAIVGATTFGSVLTPVIIIAGLASSALPDEPKINTLARATLATLNRNPAYLYLVSQRPAVSVASVVSDLSKIRHQLASIEYRYGTYDYYSVFDDLVKVGYSGPQAASVLPAEKVSVSPFGITPNVPGVRNVK